MNLDKVLSEILIFAYNQANKHKHEYYTPEHILYAAMFFKEGKDIIKGCGGNVEELKKDLEGYFSKYIPKLDEDAEPIQTVGVQRVLSTASNQVVNSGRKEIQVSDLIVALYDGDESYGGFLIKKQGIRKIDILRYISHGNKHMDDFTEEISYDSEDEDDEDTYSEEEDKNSSYLLRSFTVELTEKARKGELDPLIGREDILNRTLQVLSRRLKNNPVHVGDPGVGKTAITEGLAQLIVKNKVPSILKGFKIYSLDMASLLAGAKYRGDFEERIKKVLLKIKSQGKAIVYIDEIHTIVGSGAVSGGAMDAANILKPFLTDGKLRFIGSTTYEEYKKYFEKDRALSRRFQKIEIPETSKEDTFKILIGLKENYELYHNVVYTEEALKSAVELSSKYINEKYLPDKAIDVIDEVGAFARLREKGDTKVTITEKEVEKIISSMAKIPENNVSVNELDILKNLEDELKKNIYGQDEAIDTIVRAIKRSRAGFNEEQKPVASFLFVGQTGVGKTEIARKLSETLSIPLIRFDMSEYQEKHTVARLIGAPPGYVGYEEGGLLTDAIRKTPYAVLLLDEIEKAHGDILNVLLQIMDYATLTDNNGKKADFRNIIVIMTSNAGAREVGKTMMGFGSRTVEEDAINKEVDRVFSPEFRNRLDEIVVFNRMNEHMAYLIARKTLGEFEKKLLSKDIELVVSESCYKWIVLKGISSAYGAREIIRVVQQEVKPYFVDEVLFGKLSKGGRASLDVVEDKIIIEKIF